MSVVTNIILKTTIADEKDEAGGHPAIAEINRRLDVIGRGHLIQVDGSAGGIKAFECDVYLTTCNYLHLPDFLALVDGAFDGIERDEVQLFVQEQEADRFDVYHLRGDERGDGIVLVLEGHE